MADQLARQSLGVRGGGGGIMEGETEEAAVPFEPGKGKPPGANLEGACRSKSIRQ